MSQICGGDGVSFRYLMTVQYCACTCISLCCMILRQPAGVSATGAGHLVGVDSMAVLWADHVTIVFARGFQRGIGHGDVQNGCTTVIAFRIYSIVYQYREWRTQQPEHPHPPV